jgi:ribose transport system substrate-binding protein
MSSYARLRVTRCRLGALSVVLVVLAGSVLAGCGSSSASHSASAGGGGSPGQAAGSSSGVAAAAAAVAKLTGPVTSYPPVAPVKGTPSLRGKTVWYVPIGQSVPIVAAMGAAMQSALNHLGITTHVCDGQLLPTTIASCLNQAVTQGANAVVTSYVDYKMVPTAINNVVAHKIPVLVAGEANDAGSAAGKLLGFYNTNPTVNKLAGLAIDAATADSKGDAQILYIGADDSPALTQLNAQAAQDAQTSCPSCAFHGLTYLTPDLPKVPAEISSALVRYPNTNYVVIGEDTALAQVTQGINSAGYGTKLKVTSVNGGLAPLQTMKSGNLLVQDVGISPTYLGWGFADGIVRMMAGQTPTAYVGGIRVFDKQNVSSLTLTPAAYATNDWYGTPSFQSMFLNAWAGK